jgi:acyl-CoA thioesterase
LSQLEPDDLHNVVKSIVENPAEAQERLAELVKDPEGYDPTEDIKKIAKMLEEADQAELEELAEPKTLPKPTTPTAPTKPDKKQDPYKPTKPAIVPKRKACDMEELLGIIARRI